MKDDTQRNFGNLLYDVARIMRVAHDRRMKPLGLTRSQWWVLNRLYFNEGASQTELARFLDIEKATLGRLLDRLENNGWIERVPDAHDRRTKRVHLTKKDDPTMREMRRQARLTNEEAVQSLNDDERELMIDLLERIRGDLIEKYGPGGGPEIAADD